MAGYLSDSEPPGCPDWDAPNTNELDDQYLNMRCTRRRSYANPSPQPTPPRRVGVPAADAPDLETIPETVVDAPVDASPEEPEAAEEEVHQPLDTDMGEFRWDAGGPEDLYKRQLALAEAVFERRAYDCPHGSKAPRFRNVVSDLRKNGESVLFAKMSSEAHNRVANYWKIMEEAWTAGERRERNTSGAHGRNNPFDKKLQDIQDAKRDGVGQKLDDIFPDTVRKGKRSRASYGCANVPDALENINRALDTSLRGKAAVVASDVANQLRQAEETGTAADGVITPAPKTNDAGDVETKGRGRGKAAEMRGMLASLSNSIASREAESKQQANLRAEELTVMREQQRDMMAFMREQAQVQQNEARENREMMKAMMMALLQRDAPGRHDQ